MILCILAEGQSYIYILFTSRLNRILHQITDYEIFFEDDSKIYTHIINMMKYFKLSL